MDLSIGLQDMLQHNKIIQYFHIVLYDSSPNQQFNFGSSDYLSYLTNGLSHNTSLQELMVPIPLSSNVSLFDSLKQEEIEMIRNFYDTVLRHPSLQYVGIYNVSSEDLRMILKKMINITNKQKLPIINIL